MPTIGDVLMSPLALVDVPGAAVRGFAAGRPAGSWVQNPLTFAGRTTGRDVLRNWGLAGPQDTWGNFAGSLAVELGLDPLNWAGGLGLASRGLRGAKAVLPAISPQAIERAAVQGMAYEPFTAGAKLIRPGRPFYREGELAVQQVPRLIPNYPWPGRAWVPEGSDYLSGITFTDSVFGQIPWGALERLSGEVPSERIPEMSTIPVTFEALMNQIVRRQKDLWERYGSRVGEMEPSELASWMRKRHDELTDRAIGEVLDLRGRYGSNPKAQTAVKKQLQRMFAGTMSADETAKAIRKLIGKEPMTRIPLDYRLRVELGNYPVRELSELVPGTYYQRPTAWSELEKLPQLPGISGPSQVANPRAWGPLLPILAAYNAAQGMAR